MGGILLSPEQTKFVMETPGDVTVYDHEGNSIGRLSRHTFSQADIEEAKRRAMSDEPCHTTEQVLKVLDRLGEVLKPAKRQSP